MFSDINSGDSSKTLNYIARWIKKVTEICRFINSFVNFLNSLGDYSQVISHHVLNYNDIYSQA